MGFTLDVDLKGKGSSLSLNGGKTDINTDYKAVGEQSGIFTGDGGIDLTVEGKTTLIGGAITTTDAALAAGRNNYVSLGGIETQDIENTTSEPPRLYRRVIYLSQAAMPDRIKLS